MLDALDGPVANTDFQKLLFLYTQAMRGITQLRVRALQVRRIFLHVLRGQATAHRGRLPDRGRESLATHRLGAADGPQAGGETAGGGGFCREHAKLRGNALIAEQYRKFPYYASRSEIVEKVLPNAESRRRVAAARPAKAEPGLATIGYEGKSLESYLNQLLRAGVTLLCDVRRNPLSRKYGFAKSTLSKACEGVGIRYEHLPELGIASEERRS